VGASRSWWITSGCAVHDRYLDFTMQNRPGKVASVSPHAARALDARHSAVVRSILTKGYVGYEAESAASRE
jgi:hypothetical protein